MGHPVIGPNRGGTFGGSGGFVKSFTGIKPALRSKGQGKHAPYRRSRRYPR